MAGNTLLFSEILDKVHKAKTKDQKVKILRDNNTDALRMVIKSSFDPQITWTIPSGSVPYQPNDVPAGTEHTTLATSQESYGTLLEVQIMKHHSLRKNKCFFRCVRVYIKVRLNFLSMQKIKSYIKCIKDYQQT